MNTKIQSTVFRNAALPAYRPTGAAKSFILSLVAACMMLFAAPAVQAQNTFPSSGNVGIGTTSPSYPLDVNAGSTYGAGRLTSSSSDTVLYFTNTTADGHEYSIESSGTGTGSALGTGSFTVTDWTTGHDLFGLSSSGNGWFYGKLGIGTTSPSYTFDVSESGSNDVMRLANTEGSHRAYLDFVTYGPGDNVSSRIGAVDMGSFNNSLVFEVANNNTGGTTTTEAMRILNTGYVGIGTTSPSYPLQVNGEVYASSYGSPSDLRLKKDVKPINYGLNAVMALRPISFNWKDQSKDWQKQHQIGLSAQNVEKIIPEVVTAANDDMKTKSIAYGSLVPVLVKAIQEQQHEIDQLKKTLSVYHHDLEQQKTVTTVAALHRP